MGSRSDWETMRVTVETLERSLELIQARTPLPAKVKLPRKAERLLIE